MTSLIISCSTVFCLFAEVPKGSIIAWVPRPGKEQAPRKWQLCDGTEITEPKSPWLGLNTPDLRDSFLIGTTFDEIERTELEANKVLHVEEGEEDPRVCVHDGVGCHGNVSFPKTSYKVVYIMRVR